MKTRSKIFGVNHPASEWTAELLILADGRVLARNLTPALAQVLREVNPDDAGMSRRAAGIESSPHSSQSDIKLAKSPAPTAGRAGSPLPAASHGRFSALRGLSALPQTELDAALHSSPPPESSIGLPPTSR